MDCCCGWALLGAVILVLINFSDTIKYYFKFTVYIITCMLSATLPIPIMLTKPRDSRNALIPAWGCRVFTYALGMNCIVTGKENIINDQGCVVLINHQSALDLRVLAELWPIMDRCTQVAKKSLFYLWPFGLACWLWGTIFIDRVNAEQAQQQINKHEKAIKNRKARLLMFPEGTRGNGKELLPFKKGAFHVAVNTQCPIQPVVVSKYVFLNHDKKIFSHGDAFIHILPAIPTVNKTKNDIPELMEQVRNAMVAEFKRLNEKADREEQFNKIYRTD